MTARTRLGRSLAVILSLALSQVATPIAQAATPHVVDAQQMAARLAQLAAQRESQVKQVQEALATDAAREQAARMGLSLDRMRAAVPHLSDAELQDLSLRAARVNDLAAGHRSNDGLVILAIVLLLAGLAILVALGSDYYYDDCGCYW